MGFVRTQVVTHDNTIQPGPIKVFSQTLCFALLNFLLFKKKIDSLVKDTPIESKFCNKKKNGLDLYQIILFHLRKSLLSTYYLHCSTNLLINNKKIKNYNVHAYSNCCEFVV